MSKDNILFSDIFEIKDIDPEGKKFDRVSRLKARSENYEMDLTLDYNNELYPLEINDKFSLVLASTLSMDGVGSTASAGADKPMTWRERLAGERDLSDEYEYVTYGKVYRFDEIGSGGGGLGAGQKRRLHLLRRPPHVSRGRLQTSPKHQCRPEPLLPNQEVGVFLRDRARSRVSEL
ncbi:RNA polymerase Rpb8-domain-containing protein [Jimgerdemannia flammicorona]|uniref:RNA polymerase Rpb8-domain-containing protein n=1 Tax=Jimgerdemannia flammicorona TaxID=994334 RepID=A0A433DH94_9FUNG|nr:RNA polymerase Rpb8-domain-containing protein [Jimgerdemannia flammicorona]